MEILLWKSINIHKSEQKKCLKKFHYVDAICGNYTSQSSFFHPRIAFNNDKIYGIIAIENAHILWYFRRSEVIYGSHK